MPKYLFIESRDPFESRDTDFLEQTAIALKQRGQEVVVFLVQNGVLAARNYGHDSYPQRLTGAGVTLLADEFSLDERGIQSAELSSDIQRSNIEELVDTLVQPETKTLWH